MNNGSGLDNINRGIDTLIRQYSPERLRRFDTNSWLELYGKIDNLIFSDEICAACAKQKGKRVVRRLFVSENVPAFRYLYEHAAFPAEIAAQITELARQTARDIKQKKPKLFNALTLQQNNNLQFKKNCLKKLRKFLSANFYTLGWIKKPKLKMDVSAMHRGGYDPFSQTIYHEKSSLPADVLPHEFFHHLNNVAPSKNAEFMRRDQPAGQLLSYSSHYYFPSKMQEKTKAYKHQPTEYGAYLFAFQFSRELNRLVNRSQQLANNIANNTLGLMDEFNIDVNESRMDERGELVFTIKNLKNAHHRKLEEICEKMLQTQYETLSGDSGRFALPISEKQNALVSQSFHKVHAKQQTALPGCNEREFLPELKKWQKDHPKEYPDACNRNNPPKTQNLKQKVLGLFKGRQR